MVQVKGAGDLLSGKRPGMGRHHTKLLLMTFNPLNPQWIIHFIHNKTLGLCLFVLDIKPNTQLCPKISVRLIISYASLKISLFYPYYATFTFAVSQWFLWNYKRKNLIYKPILSQISLTLQTFASRSTRMTRGQGCTTTGVQKEGKFVWR